jgi:hypothetical protein
VRRVAYHGEAATGRAAVVAVCGQAKSRSGFFGFCFAFAPGLLRAPTSPFAQSAKMTHVALAQIARNNALPRRHNFASYERLNFNQSF